MEPIYKHIHKLIGLSITPQAPLILLARPTHCFGKATWGTRVLKCYANCHQPKRHCFTSRVRQVLLRHSNSHLLGNPHAAISTTTIANSCKRVLMPFAFSVGKRLFSFGCLVLMERIKKPQRVLRRISLLLMRCLAIMFRLAITPSVPSAFSALGRRLTLVSSKRTYATIWSRSKIVRQSNAVDGLL